MAASVIELLILLGAFGANAGFPLGMPPGPEHELLYKVAPEDCMYFATWTGTKAIDPTANPTEKWMSQKEIQDYASKIEQLMADGISNALPSTSDKMDVITKLSIELVREMMRSPTALYVEKMSFDEAGLDNVVAALITRLGDSAQKFESKLNKIHGIAPTEWKPEKTTIGGSTYHSLLMPETGQRFYWGRRNEYFVAGIGKGSIETLEKNSQTPAPAWLKQIRETLTVDRVATVSYLNMGPIQRMINSQIDQNEWSRDEMQMVYDMSGLGTLESIGWVTGLDSNGFISRASFDFGGVRSGVMDLFKGSSIADKYLSRVPGDSTVALATRLSVQEIWEMIGKTAPRGGMEDMQSEFEKEMGFKLKEDLLDQLDNFVGIYGTVSVNNPTKGWVLSIGVKDTEKFAPTYAKLSPIIESMFPQIMNEMGFGFRREEKRAVPLKRAVPDKIPEKIEIDIDRPDGGPSARNEVVQDADKIQVGDVEVTAMALEGLPIAVKVYWCLSNDEFLISLDLKSIKNHINGITLEKSIVSDAVMKSILSVADAAGHKDLVAVTHLDTRKTIEIVYGLLPMMAMMTGSEIPEEFMPPGPEVLGNGMGPTVNALYRTELGYEMIGRQTFPSSSPLASVGLAGGMLVPIMTSGRMAAQQVDSKNRMRQIAIAMHNFHDANRGLPANHSSDEDGKPLLSWRVHLLPYMEGGGLYKQFHLDEPWDSPNNKKLIAKMPEFFEHPRIKLEPGQTLYVAPFGDNTPISKPGKNSNRGTTLEVIANADGNSNTIVIVEANKNGAEVWTKPGGFDPEGGQLRGLLEGNWPDGSIIAAFGDASIHSIPEKVTEKIIEQLMNYQDGAPDREWENN